MGQITLTGLAVLGNAFMYRTLPEYVRWALMCFVFAARASIFCRPSPRETTAGAFIVGHGLIAATGSVPCSNRSIDSPSKATTLWPKKSGERTAETGHRHGREQSEEEAHKIKKTDPNESSERKGAAEQKPTS